MIFKKKIQYYSMKEYFGFVTTASPNATKLASCIKLLAHDKTDKASNKFKKTTMINNLICSKKNIAQGKKCIKKLTQKKYYYEMYGKPFVKFTTLFFVTSCIVLQNLSHL
jgi:predicted S18 family serine protease